MLLNKYPTRSNSRSKNGLTIMASTARVTPWNHASASATEGGAADVSESATQRRGGKRAEPEVSGDAEDGRQRSASPVCAMEDEGEMDGRTELRLLRSRGGAGSAERRWMHWSMT